jgi:hypothetical protein
MDIRGAFNDNSTKKNNRILRVRPRNFLLILIALLPLGYTLAVNINLGSDSALEFGQGIVVTAACDDYIQIVPGAEFDNQNSKSFGVKSLFLTDISNSCIGKTFSINFYSETSSVSSNSYGPLVLSFIESGTAGLHFELVGTLSSIGSISEYVVDTGTAGVGNLGSTTYRGASSVSFDNILSADFSPYAVEETRKITLQSSRLMDIAPHTMTDSYSTICLNTSSSNVNDLIKLFSLGGKRADAGLALADFADLQAANFQSKSVQQKSLRAADYSQTAVSGIRINAFIKSRILLCEAHVTSLLNGESDQNKIDRLNENLQMISDLIDIANAVDGAFAYLKTSTNPYL